MTFITNNRPKPADMRGIDPAAIYREVKPAAVNQQAVKPAAPAVLPVNMPKPSDFDGYSINATNAAAEEVKPAHAGEFSGYSLNEHLEP